MKRRGGKADKIPERQNAMCAMICGTAQSGSSHSNERGLKPTSSRGSLFYQ
ncbi:hypothetical protein HMPREF0860_2105 [Treponema socranskii subsp. socranskii VPI DR56BR1116 = ATCC 35536]|uniref:Uncharacterized protein n=1 Tax=Treponema socranskii subsp. socranskii VPI DR56BR1116 = ATCC 35536 TaxID=1125725 RepID=U1FLE1_TRESO|nr:hypothetical protein HMPREF1325_0287 [Treponema socranskii subsp. socranskii VPI DR56BR1116 = ATCC 35536]ERK00137.1 hypothetical protein HMPREF0860_2105 [Treponema socranskii subsp. socranskii VPI DR56BR1116 = ATCC 35536]